jgi:dTDP-4-dehydrorhamnose 3,5-epimerase
MEIEKTHISGLQLIHGDRFVDLRGNFHKVFTYDIYRNNGLDCNFKESYYSISKKDVLRGMHFQVPPAEHNKLVLVNQGSIMDVVLDLRKNSEAYGSYFKILLSGDDSTMVYIPSGCAHGFLSLENNTIVTYNQTSVYNPNYDLGIRYDSFGLDWGCKKIISSERDNNFPPLSEYLTPF